MIKVVIPEGIPSLNKGEAAILEGIHEILSVCGKHEITLYSPDSWRADDARNYANLARVVGGIDLHNKSGHTPQGQRKGLGFYARIQWCRLFIFAVLSRVSGSLAKHLFKDDLLTAMLEADVILVAHDGMMGPAQSKVVRAGCLMNKSVAILGGGCGSSVYIELSNSSRKKLKYIANNTACCVVRDAQTKDLLLASGAKEDRVRLAPDPAVLLPPCDDKRTAEILDAEDVPPSARDLMCAVVLAEGGILSRESFGKTTRRDNKRRLHIELWKELLLHLLNTTDACIVFLPHSIGPTPQDDDRNMAQDVYKALVCDKNRVKCINTEYSAGELKGIMKNCQLVLSERAHAAIGAFSAGTPCVGFTVKKDIRMHGIINDMFRQRIVELDEPDISQFKTLITDEWNNRHQKTAEMAERVAMILKDAQATALWVKSRLEDRLGHKL